MTIDSHEFETLVRPHLDRLYRLAYRLTGSVADAEDLLQEVLIKLYRRGDELSSIRDLSPWLGRVLYNQFVDHRRRYRKHRLRLVSVETDLRADFLISEWPEPDTEAARTLDIRGLTRALAAISDEHRMVVLLHDAEGYTLEEIQRITGVPLGTLKSRLHRARARLRELIAADGTF